MNYRFKIFSLMLCMILSGCATPNRNLVQNHKPINTASLDFPVVIFFEYDCNEFIVPYDLMMGIDSYLTKYTPIWKFQFGAITKQVKIEEHDQIIKIKLRAYKTPLGFNDPQAEIKISSSLIKEPIELTLKQESSFNWTKESWNIDSYNIGVVTAEGIVNALNSSNEFQDNAKLLSKKYRIEEQKRLEEEKKKLSPEVGNQEALKHYISLVSTNSYNELQASIEAFNKAVTDGYKPTSPPWFNPSLYVINETSEEVVFKNASNTPFTPLLVKKDELINKINSTDKVIVIQPALATIKRDVINQSKINSKYISGYTEQNNPNYDVAYREYLEALNNYNRVQLEVSMSPAPQSALAGLGQGLSNAAKTVPASNRLESAKQTLAQTPRTNSVPVELPYTFNKMKVKVTKEFEYHAYIINQDKKKILVKSFPEIESKEFILQYDKHSKDCGDFNQYSKEEDVTDYEKMKYQLDVKTIIEKLKETPPASYETTRLDNSLAFLKPVEITKNLPSSQIHTTNEGGLSKLISSVVAIQDNGGTTIGTGFFVTKNLILTNNHVVEGKQFISIKDKDKNSYSARIINRSHELDIATLEVNGAGHPAEIYSGPPLSEGDEVIAIGNPVGLEFSVTKGIVSSVRKRKKEIPLAKEHLYIQTDVSINPGNSGGPLFHKGQVVGINTLKIVSKNVEGIGFAIHYSEVSEYLSGSNVHFDYNKPTSVAKSVQDSQITEKLKKLKALHDSGLINDTEYNDKKKELLKNL